MFEMTKTDKKLAISFSSVLENIDIAADKTKQFLYEHNFKKQAFAILLILRESLINAVTHGNNSDENKLVKYELKLENNEIVIKVKDKGEGFDWKLRQKKEPDTRADSGRGMNIMSNYGKCLQYNEKGNCMEVSIKLIDK